MSNNNKTNDSDHNKMALTVGVTSLVDVIVTDSVTTTNITDQPELEDARVFEGLAVVECLLVAIGFCGNIMLFILMQSKRMKKYSFSVYFSFAAVFDTLSIFWNGLQDTYEVANSIGLEQNVPTPYSFGCGVMELFDGWFVLTSAWLMVFLSFDRFMSICHPRIAEKVCSRKVAFVICTSIVLITSIIGLPWALIKGPSQTDNDPNKTVQCGDEPEADFLEVLDLFLLFLIPVVCATSFNILILVKLKERMAFRREESLTERGQSQNKLNRLNVTIFYLLVMTVLTWVPLAVVNLTEMVYFQWQGHDDTSVVRANIDYAWHASLVIWLLTFVQNFYVLMVLSPVYRKELKRQCSCLPCISIKYDGETSEHNEIIDNEQTNDEI